MVMLYHYISRQEATALQSFRVVTDFGYLGVPFFFMISGFVIAMSATNRSPFEFAISRFARLYPALWLCILFTVLVVYIIEGDMYPITQILANMTLLNEYLGQANIDAVYWTLKAELKFYFCILILMIIGLFSRDKIWLSLWALMALAHFYTDEPFFMGWFISPYYSSYFIAGVAFYMASVKGYSTYWFAILVLSLYISLANSINQVDGFVHRPENYHYYGVSIVVVFFYLFFAYVSQAKSSRSERARLYSTIGGLTYPLYLIHNVAGVSIIDNFRDKYNETIVITLTSILMIFLSWLISRYYERTVSSHLKHYLLSDNSFHIRILKQSNIMYKKSE